MLKKLYLLILTLAAVTPAIKIQSRILDSGKIFISKKEFNPFERIQPQPINLADEAAYERLTFKLINLADNAAYAKLTFKPIDLANNKAYEALIVKLRRSFLSYFF